MMTPGKPESPPLHPNNRTVDRIHYKIKQPTTNPNTWHIQHTDYRRTHETFSATILTTFERTFAKLIITLHEIITCNYRSNAKYT